MDNVLVEFVRGKRNRIVGAVVAIGRNEVGWSLCSKQDMRFGTVADKDKAVSIAIGRAIARSNPERMPPSIAMNYVKMVQRSERYFK